MKGWRQGLLWGLVGLTLLSGMGCARHGVSAALRQRVDATVSFEALRANPSAYMDRIVMVGGMIVSAQPLAQGTLVTVAQHPLDRLGRPLQTDNTMGRFMALCDEYLEPVVYAQDRQITVAGKVLGARLGKVGERDYIYPLITCLETKLWPHASHSTRNWAPWDGHHKRHHHHHHN